jgi:hypothetical protein
MRNLALSDKNDHVQLIIMIENPIKKSYIE